MLSNADGIVYEAMLQPGDLKRKGRKFQFIDRNARKGTGTHDGLFKVEISDAQDDLGTRVTIQAFDDLQAATLAEMTLEISVGGDTVLRTDLWQTKAYGWINRHR